MISATSLFQATSIFGWSSTRCAELFAAVHDGDLRGETRQEQCFLHRGVASADDDDLLLTEEESITRRTPRQPVAGQSVLFG